MHLLSILAVLGASAVGLIALLRGAEGVWRTGIFLGLSNFAAWEGGLSVSDWQVLIALNLTCVWVTAWHPAGRLQAFVAAGYLAQAIICLAYAFSYQTYNAQWVAYSTMTAITIWQALLTMIAGGGLGYYSLGRSYGSNRAVRALARFAHKPDRP